MKDWETLDKFLDKRCFDLDDLEVKEVMKLIDPEYEGSWGITKSNLKEFLLKEKQSLLIQIEEIVDGMKRKPTFKHFAQGELHDDENIAYNKALDDFTEKFNKLKE